MTSKSFSEIEIIIKQSPLSTLLMTTTNRASNNNSQLMKLGKLTLHGSKNKRYKFSSQKSLNIILLCVPKSEPNTPEITEILYKDISVSPVK